MIALCEDRVIGIDVDEILAKYYIIFNLLQGLCAHRVRSDMLSNMLFVGFMSKVPAERDQSA